MKLSEKQVACIFGLVMGLAIIFAGVCVQGISVEIHNGSIGRDIAFGADFYTEMYDVTRDVGYAVNGTKAAIADAAEGVCDAIGWLIIALGVIDFCYFTYKWGCVTQEANSQHANDTHYAPQAVAYKAKPTPNTKSDAATQKVEASTVKAAENSFFDEYWVCSKCKTKNLNTRNDCWSCGNLKQEKTTTHKWLCDGCNKMRTQTPCEHCGKE